MNLATTSRLIAISIALCQAAASTALASDVRLVDAVKMRDSATVSSLLAKRVDVNSPAPDGATALHWAAHWDDHDLVARLIAAGANVNSKNDLGVTPLALACENASLPVATLLVEHGGDVNLPANGEAPLMIAARSGNEKLVSFLLARRAEVNATDPRHGQTALMWAVAHRHADVVKQLLSHGADLGTRSKTDSLRMATINRYGGTGDGKDRGVVDAVEGGGTALLFAAREGDVASAQLLLDAGADPNDRMADGTGALVLAAHSGNSLVAKLLLERGADPNDNRVGYTALLAAVLRGDGDLVSALLSRGANPNARLERGTTSRRYSKDYALDGQWVGATPFWLAARFAELGIMKTLAAAGADTKMVANDGATPLVSSLQAGTDSGPTVSDRRGMRLDPEEHASQNRHWDEHEKIALDTVKLAVELGADVNQPNMAGDTALHFAASKRLNSVIEYLVSQGATVDVPNERGATPLANATAAERRIEEGDVGPHGTADLLKRLGAKGK